MKDNLLKVPAKAHYTIHHLMWKAFPEDNSMRYAFWKFCNDDKRNHRVTAKVYENLKNNLSHSEETKQKMKRKNISYETENLLIEKVKLFPMSTNRKSVLQINGKTSHRKGKFLTEEHKQNLSTSKRGKPSPNKR